MDGPVLWLLQVAAVVSLFILQITYVSSGHVNREVQFKYYKTIYNINSANVQHNVTQTTVLISANMLDLGNLITPSWAI
jgi:hypothetical protein